MADAKKPRLLDQLRAAIRVRHYGRFTEKAYVYWARFFIRYHNLRHPRELREREVEAFLGFLAIERHVAAATQNQALNALVFLYKNVLKNPLGEFSAPRAKQQRRLPVVLSRQEIDRILEQLEGRNALIIRLLYGTGLRLMEALRLRIQDIDFDRNMILVRDGKGKKDRVALLPASLRNLLIRAIDHARQIHQLDRVDGFGETSLPYALARKYPRAAWETGWQYVFPASARGIDPESKRIKRHHIHHTAIFTIQPYKKSSATPF